MPVCALAAGRGQRHFYGMANTTVLLGLECGGTRTVALAADGDLNLLTRIAAGPANLRLVTDAQLVAHFQALAPQLPAPSAIGLGMAGVRDRRDCVRVEGLLAQVWPGVPHRVDHDLASALAAAEMTSAKAPPTARVIVLSGTGSCCYGRNRAGLTAKVGGWGHQLGDRGSAYDLAQTALRLMARRLDHTEKLGDFGQRVLRVLLLNEPNDLIGWFQTASKGEVAALAPEVFAAAERKDPIAVEAVRFTEAELVADAAHCAARLSSKRSVVQFAFAGSVLLKQPQLAQRVGRELQRLWPRASFGPLERESVWGAVAMARSVLQTDGEVKSAASALALAQRVERAIPEATAVSPTELRNPRSTGLDRLSLGAAIDLMLDEEAQLPAILRAHRAELEKLIRLTARALKAGGRLFYVGAGSSGRLGVLDASECPPTFRTSPELVQGIMAGGVKALHSAVEGAEDDYDAGGRATAARQVGPKDVVVGLAASGRTPFVWGALAEAKRQGAKTAIVCCNPFLKFIHLPKPDVVLALNLGPEVLTGSTRLKAGTATKLILNLLTTLTMVRLGKVVGNLMVDLNPSNVKLRDRACRIVMELTGRDYPTAQAALEQAGWIVKAAVSVLGRHK